MRPSWFWVIIGLIVGVSLIIIIDVARAHDHTRPDLDQWFRTLYSDRGPCCDNGEASRIEDPDWRNASEMHSGADCTPSSPVSGEDPKDAAFCVRLEDPYEHKMTWWRIPKSAVVTMSPNKAGPALIWFSWVNSGSNIGTPHIRCFMPGGGS